MGSILVQALGFSNEKAAKSKFVGLKIFVAVKIKDFCLLVLMSNDPCKCREGSAMLKSCKPLMSKIVSSLILFLYEWNETVWKTLEPYFI